MRKWTFCFVLFLGLSASAQDSLSAAPDPAPRPSAGRKWLAGGVSALGYGGSFVFLNEAWYKNYPRSSFHTFDDSGEWLQMDKLGHAWTAYHTSRVTSAMWQWAGVRKNTAVLLGSGSSLLYMLSIEYLDGLSAEWGWSWPDAGADLFGALLYAGQEIGWKRQTVQLKFSAHTASYAGDLETRANELFGRSLPERILKDYNAQTYWLSLNLHDLFPKSRLPKWLNLAIGHGAEGMYGGYDNVGYDKSGNLTFDRRDIPRRRQWYLSPDIDLTRISTRSKFLRGLLGVVNVLKIPAPALEFSDGSFSFKPLHF